MRAHRLLFAAWTVVASGCFLLDSPSGVAGSGGPFEDDDDDDAALASGIYSLVDASVEPVTCGVVTNGAFAQFSEVEVYATANVLEMEFDGYDMYFDVTQSGYETTFEEENSPYVYDGVDFEDPDTYEFFGLTTGADCVLSGTVRYHGIVVDYYTFTFEDELRLEPVSGTECSGVATSAGFATLPCEDLGHTTWAM